VNETVQILLTQTADGVEETADAGVKLKDVIMRIEARGRFKVRFNLTLKG
jgi:hypothetical protein